MTEQEREAAGTAMFGIVAVIGFSSIYVAAGTFGTEAQSFPRLAAVLGGIGGVICVLRTGPALLAGGWAGLRELFHGNGSRLNFILSYVGPAVYAALLYLLGFWVASAASLIGLFLLLGERRPLLVLGLTALTLAMLYVIFVMGFDIRMPGSAVFEFLGASS